MGALICNYLPDEASREHEFSTMNRQDGHLQFDPKRSNLRSYAHGQLRLEQSKLAIALGGRLQERVENKRSVNFHRFGLGDAGCLIDSRVADLCNHVGFTDVAAPRGCWRLFEQKKSSQSDH
jgi:hypothetical protein